MRDEILFSSSSNKAATDAVYKLLQVHPLSAPSFECLCNFHVYFHFAMYRIYFVFGLWLWCWFHDDGGGGVFGSTPLELLLSSLVFSLFIYKVITQLKCSADA